MTRIPVRRALISVSDKRGLEDFARRLSAAGVEITSSGGTAATLARAGIAVRLVGDVTGSPEILGGRVKTLHPRIHGGILAKPGDPDHRADLEAQQIQPFELVVVNLYPFREAVARADVTEEEAIENIDIGGPAMIRAAAKNHAAVAVLTSPDHYGEVAEAVEAGGTDGPLRRRLARQAFFHTAAYDAAIVGWFERGDDELPRRLVLPMVRTSVLRYGENPHQRAAAYRVVGADPWWARAEQVQGREMSFNNYADADAAWRLVHDLDEPAAVVVKHTNPCGAAQAGGLADALERAWAGDPVAAFGGVVAVNRRLDGATAEWLSGRFVEVVVAPEIAPEARQTLSKKASLRLMAAPAPERGGLEVRGVDSGFLAQDRDAVDGEAAGFRVAGVREPGEDEWADLVFAWKVAAHTTSNAIVVARDRQAVGVGAGDQSRVGAARRALVQAGDRASGAVAASDAFFPFRDGIDVLAAEGVTAVIEPGGSKRDDEVVAAADEHGMAVVFTGTRHFLH